MVAGRTACLSTLEGRRNDKRRGKTRSSEKKLIGKGGWNLNCVGFFTAYLGSC